MSGTAEDEKSHNRELSTRQGILVSESAQAIGGSFARERTVPEAATSCCPGREMMGKHPV